MPQVDEVTEMAQFCTFWLGGLLVGIDARQVQEVLRHDRMTEVPLAPPEVRGLINLRGQIVTAIDLRHQLGLEGREGLGASVVVKAGEEVVSLLVDEVGEVVSPALDDFEPVPEGVPVRVREIVGGTYKLPGKLLLVLDVHKLASHLEARAGSPERVHRDG
ncbi:MAG: chemotaxis protein CheW [Acidimicrobiales bacterium]